MSRIWSLVAATRKSRIAPSSPVIGTSQVQPAGTAASSSRTTSSSAIFAAYRPARDNSQHDLGDTAEKT